MEQGETDSFHLLAYPADKFRVKIFQELGHNGAQLAQQALVPLLKITGQQGQVEHQFSEFTAQDGYHIGEHQKKNQDQDKIDQANRE